MAPAMAARTAAVGLRTKPSSSSAAPGYNAGVNVLVNGKPYALRDDATLGELIQTLVPAPRRIAVEVNEAIVPAAEHARFRLAADDRVEIIEAIGGG